MDQTERIARLETQMGRLVSDIESEKGTRVRVHSEFSARISALERTVWQAVGAVATIHAITILYLSLRK